MATKSAFKEGLYELYIYFKDWILSKTILVKNREMFFLQSVSYNETKVWRIRISPRKITHRAWFSELNLLGVNISIEDKNLLRGYYNPKSQILFVYSGLKHSLPDFSDENQDAFLTVYNYFRRRGVKEFRLGSISEGFSRKYRTLIGKDFKEVVKLDTDALENNCVCLLKIN